MNRANQATLNPLYGLIGLFGVFLVCWGIMSIMDPSYIPSITVPWIDQTLTAVGQHVWIPAVGVLFLVIGLSPLMISAVRRNRVAQIVLGSIGVIFLCVSGVMMLFALSPLVLTYISPLILSGVILVAITLGIHDVESVLDLMDDITQ